VSGTNVVGVEIHQVAANSSDVSFNLELFGTGPGSPPPPVLDYTWDGAVLTLSWPAPAGASGWALYAVNDMNGDAIWAPVLGGIMVNGRWVVAVTPGIGARFYRLQKP
jgi:hypothetical protein